MDCHICGDPLSDPVTLHPITRKIEPCRKCKVVAKEANWELDRKFAKPEDECEFEVLGDEVFFEDSSEE